MAVDHDEHVPTEDLILSKPRRHFRTTVHAIHWQLRSLIGVRGQNVVYYVTGDENKNIQRLNTTTLESETIKRLPFSPRCLVAENGWICCGGEFGDFTAIQLQDGPAFNPYNVSLGLADLDETDSPPPEDLIFLSLARARSAKNLMADSKKFGKELVNCITVWFPPTLSQPFVGAYAEPMAVLSNNDKTVTMIKLQSQEAEQVLSFPDCVNRAIISPDGRLLVAITDDPYLYMHERVEKSSNWGPFRGTDRPTFEWKACGRIHLRHQSPDAPTTVRGSFAACFSSTGKYLAIGTQSASISIFNVEALTVPGVDPLLTCFFASRPNAEHGAVRDMAFAPGCSDLLAWTEDRGRVGVVDLRNGYISRQIVALDKTEDFEHITITDRTTIDPRLLEQRGSDTLTSAFASTLDLSLENRNIRADARDAREALARYLPPLTREETSVLDAITEQRRRQQDREQRGQQGATRPDTASPNPRSAWADRITRSGPTSDNAATASRERSSSITRTVNEIMGGIRDQRERMRELRDAEERLRGPTRDDNTSSTDRRRAPVPPSGRTSAQTQATAPALERRSLRLAMDHIIGNPTLREASELAGYTPYGSGFDPSSFTTRNATNTNNNSRTNNNNSGAGAPAATYTADLDRRRDRAAYLMREWEENRNENRNRRIERFFARGEMMATDPFDTSGLAWSDDGQILFIGADDGIFELHVNQQSRKLFSSVSMR